jgi:RecB family exonuclease
MGDHASISPSALARHAACPGNSREVAKLPPELRNQSSQAAEDGTRRHEILYHANVNGYIKPTDNAEDDRLVALAWPYFRDHPARTSPQGLWLPEEKVEISRHIEGLPEDLCWGTADMVCAHKDTVEIIDAKFGRIPVNPDCEQLWAYAYGGVRKLLNPDGTWLQDHRQTKYLKLTIVQPQAPEIVNSASFPLVPKLKEIKTWLEQTLKAAMDPDAPLVPGDHCKWCAARDTCPARRDMVFTGIQSMFDAVPEPQATETSEVDIIEQIIEEHMSKSPDDLTPEEKGRILDFAPMVEQWLKDLRKVCEQDLLSGRPVEGYKLVKGRGSREWGAEEDQVVAKLKGLGFKVGDIYTKKLVSPAQAEKTPVVAGSRTKQKKLGELWVKKEGKPTLAPESDPAPAIDPLHAEVFDNLDTPPTEQPQYDWL